jgi:hypothetical protein
MKRSLHTTAGVSPGEYGEAQARMSTVQPPRELGGLEPGARPGQPDRMWMDSPVIRHLAVLASYLAVGIVVTWPRATYLVEGKLPATRDAGAYVWDFWWMLHQVEHLGNPWFTRSIAAPVGSQLGYHALMPLEGMLMLPVTLAFGPSASYNLLSILMPGLLCYAAYRAARLWLRSQPGAIAAGAFYGLSADLAWHAWYQLNLAAGMLFLPLALEAAVRLSRRPGWRQSIVLGLVLGASLLTDQQSAVLAVAIAVAALLPWLLRREPGRRGSESGQSTGPGLGRKLGIVGVAAAVALVVSSPQIAAMAVQARSGGASYPLSLMAHDYTKYNASLPGAFSISPRTIRFGLTSLRAASYHGRTSDGIPTYGLALSVLAVLGLAASWRRRTAWWLAALWLGATVLALGSTLRIGGHIYVPVPARWHDVHVSALMPYTWFVQVPGMSGFREAARMVLLGLLPASLLAGAAIDWLRYHLPWLIVPVALLALLEAGWAGYSRIGVMHTALPALDRPIAADHSGSLVVDVPWGVRGGVSGVGAEFDPEAQVLATADGHPRAIGYLSRLPSQVTAQLQHNAFYAGLQAAQGTQPVSGAEALTGTHGYPELIAAARAQARRMNVGWVIVWPPPSRHGVQRYLAPPRQSIQRYLAETGFRISYRAQGALVYRPVGAAAVPSATSRVSS